MPPQTLKAEYFGPANELTGTAAADLACGDVVIGVDGRVGVVTAMTGFKTGQQYRATTQGLFKVACLTTATFTAAARPLVYWDSTAKQATTVSAGNTVMGRAAQDKANGPAFVYVLLNDPLTAAT